MNEKKARTISPRRYFLTLIASTFALLFTVSAFGIWGVFFDELFGYQIFYNYQLRKIADLEGVETVFVGDSSMGNSIDAEHFSRQSGTRSANLALTGLYGYAGSYNMLKRMEDHPVENVVIMTTPDTFSRGVSYGGYLLTMADTGDFQELSRDEQSRTVAAFYHMILSSGNFKATLKSLLGFGKRRFEMESDYIQQNNPIDPREYPPLEKSMILPAKTRFLEKLLQYCKERDINVIHVHGPVYEGVGSQSTEYLAEVNRLLSETGVQNIPDITLIPLAEIGDSADHVAPKFKAQYTERYVRLISPRLRTNSPAGLR